MLRISTFKLAFVLRKFYQFNEPTHIIDAPCGNARVFIVLRSTSSGLWHTCG